jgi:hypothetical protein
MPLKTRIPRIYRRSIVWVGILAAALLAGCGTPTGTPDGSPVPEATATAAPTAAPTDTVEPTAIPPLVVLLAPPGGDPELQTAIEAIVSAEAAARGLRWQMRQTMTGAEIAAEVDYLVALPPQPELNALAAAAPGTRFLAIGGAGAEPAGNLILVEPASGAEEIAAFMGGYVGALLIPDARIGIITVQDDLESLRFAAFENGMRFYCGLCRPQVAPFYAYPFLLSLPAEASAVEWRALADFMRDRLVGAVYVTPEAGGADLIEALVDHGIRVIGGTPPPAGAEPAWITSLRMDPLAGYAEFVPALLDGETGIAASLPLELTDVNPQLLTAGKLRLAQVTLSDLLAGYIFPGDVD